MKDMGILHYFLSIEVVFSPKGLLLTQQKYICDILSRDALTNTKLVDTPIEVNAKMGLTDGSPLPDTTRFLQVVNSPVYYTITRPEISFSIHAINHFVAAQPCFIRPLCVGHSAIFNTLPLRE